MWRCYLQKVFFAPNYLIFLGTYCPLDRCEQIHPVDRAVCAPIISRIANNEEITQFECESAGCCYDTFQEQCYSSSPSVKSPYPDTGECAQVEPSDRESCGFGLSRDSCAAMTGTSPLTI